jgi:ABC-2 type transport system ATP-binding protein
LKEQGKTVFFSSHILADIERFCDRYGIIVGGRLRKVERVDQLLAGGESLEDVFLDEVAKASEGVTL